MFGFAKGLQRDASALLGYSCALAICAFCMLAYLLPMSAFADDEDQAGTYVAGATATADQEDLPGDADSSSSSSSSSKAESDSVDSSSDYSAMSLSKLKQVVTDKTAERDKAQTLLDELSKRVTSTTGQLEKTRAKLVEQQALAERSVRERYKVQSRYPTLVDALLDAKDWQSFVAGIEYIEAASRASVDGVVKSREEVAYLEKELERLEKEKTDADKHLTQVSAELEAATRARDEAQRKADLVTNARLKADGANWKAGKKKFVAEWGPRIDAYLEGSPMAGQGDTFAEAAWENHIDPRFSPAISNIESGKGSICIRPYNAWGWGAADPNPAGLASAWSSWEEAIFAHVSGLKAGYGYTISKKGAKKYCPPNWQVWYATTVDQMNSI